MWLGPGDGVVGGLFLSIMTLYIALFMRTGSCTSCIDPLMNARSSFRLSAKGACPTVSHP